MSEDKANVDPAELAKFEAMAARWWDPTSESKLLHDINPLRLCYIDERARLTGKRVVDVGCGGGLLAEGMVRLGAEVTGIDMGEAALTVARLHLYESGLKVDYRRLTAEQLAQEAPEGFDVVTCMEMLEHVPDPASVVRACGRLVKPRGHVFFSTLNRNLKSYLYAILGAEYILGLLPKGTHQYPGFIRPSELAAWMRAADLELRELTGLSYHPFTRHHALTSDISVNYLAHAMRPE